MEKPKPNPIKLPKTIELSEFSEASQEILQHFGLDAPNLLNVYCCALEDALVEQVESVLQKIQEIKRLRALLEEHDISYGQPPSN